MNVDIKELARKAGMTRIKDNQYANVTEEQLLSLIKLALENINKSI